MLTTTKACNKNDYSTWKITPNKEIYNLVGIISSLSFESHKLSWLKAKVEAHNLKLLMGLPTEGDWSEMFGIYCADLAFQQIQHPNPFPK